MITMDDMDDDPEVIIQVGKLSFPVADLWVRGDNVLVIQAASFTNVPDTAEEQDEDNSEPSPFL